MAIRAVAFDIDGTLYPNWGMYLMNFGFGLKHYRRLRAFARVRNELHRRALDPDSRADPPRDLVGFRQLQARLLSELIGSRSEEASRWAEDVMYGELELKFHKVRPFAGVEPTLRRLSAAGLRLAALSDFPAPRKLEILGFRDYFEVAMSSEETGMLKPAPEPFLGVAERLGLDPSEILYVGNSLRLDIAGAKRVGMLAALIGTEARMKRAREPYAPRSFDELDHAVPDLIYTNWDVLVDFALARAEKRRESIPPLHDEAHRTKLGASS